MDHIENSVLNILNTKNNREKYFLYKLRKRWINVAGKNIEQHTEPIKIEKRVLWIKTDNPVWSNHLLMMKRQFIGNINEFLQDYKIKDLVFVNSSDINNFVVEESDENEILEFPLLNSDEIKRIKENTQYIKNENLRDKVNNIEEIRERRSKYYQNEDKKCVRCGAFTHNENNVCNVCQRYENENLRKEIASFICFEPWSDYETCKNKFNCDRLTYESVVNSLKNYYYAKVEKNEADLKEEIIAISLKTGKSPMMIDDNTYKNVISNLRRN